MLIRAVVICCAVLKLTVANAQEESGRTVPPAPKSFVSTIVIRNILRDYNIGYAHRIGMRHTLEARLGWVHPNRIISNYYEKYLMSTDWKFNGVSFHLQLNKWKFASLLKKQRQLFYGVYAGYRYLYYTDDTMPMGGKDHNSMDEELTLSQWRNDILLFGTMGVRLSKFTTTELSFGVCFSWTHTNVSDTRFYPSPPGTSPYDAYKEAQANRIFGAEGFSAVPVLRLSSRLGFFNW